MSLVLRTTKQQFRQKVMENYRYNYRRLVPQIKKAVRSLINDELREAFFSHHTVISLQNGALRSQLGLQEPAVKLYEIFSALATSLDVRVKSNRQDHVLNLSIELGRSDFQDILRLSAAYQDWTGADGEGIRGEPLPWLEWLLEEGDNVIIADFRYSVIRTGRSNLPGIMIPGKGWRVPTEHSGTLTSNFITEILAVLGERMDKKLWAIVRRVLTQGY